MPMRAIPGTVPGPPGLRQPEGERMPLYECVLLARNDLTQQQVEAIADQIAAITAEGGAR